MSHDQIGINEAVEFAEQVAAALASRSWQGIIHRDIKPETSCCGPMAM
jgi:hypothetical protein